MNIKLFFKGVLLYVTFFICTFIILGIDSIYDQGYFCIAIMIAAGFIYWCKKTITEEEFNILSLYNFFIKQGILNKE